MQMRRQQPCLPPQPCLHPRRQQGCLLLTVLYGISGRARAGREVSGQTLQLHPQQEGWHPCVVPSRAAPILSPSAWRGFTRSGISPLYGDSYAMLLWGC